MKTHALALPVWLMMMLLAERVTAQDVEVSTRLTAVGGREAGESLGVRLHVGTGRLDAFASGALRVTDVSCFPEDCDQFSGDALEVMGGLRYRHRVSERLTAHVSAGGGSLRWRGGRSPFSSRTADSFVSGDGGILVRLSSRTSLILAGVTDILLDAYGARFYGVVAGIAVRLTP
jgi:hypothetical protein